jgi:hypothetical protein
MKLGGKFHATLDVKRGQYTLIKQVAKAPVPVILRGYIVEVLGQDEVSTEFRLEITDVETNDPAWSAMLRKTSIL